MSRFARKERPPPGFEILEPTLNALENELRESEYDMHPEIRLSASPNSHFTRTNSSVTAVGLLLSHTVRTLFQGEILSLVL